jgi:hypothetical protein
MFGMDILTDKKKQDQIQSIVTAIVKTINETYKLAKENNDLLKKLTKKED